MQISKSVGKNAHGQNVDDVTTIQSALAACKCKKYKPFYQGRIDGKCGPKTICAIEQFQLESNINVTGKLDTYGQTINRLKQKAPAIRVGSTQNTSHKSNVSPTSIGLDTNKVQKTNTTLADEIKRKWPLPLKEAEDLAKTVVRVGKELGIPLMPNGKNPVNIDNQGAFTVAFDIPSWGYNNNTSLKSKVIANVCEMVSKSPAWQKGDNISLRFRSTTKFAELTKVSKPSHKFIKSLGLLSLPSDSVILACLALAENKMKG